MALSAAEPDLGLSGALQPPFVRTGERITYSLRVANSSPAPATGAYMFSETPTNLTFVASSSSQGACAMNDGFVWCDFGTVTNGTNIAISLTFRADFPGSFSHTFSVSHDELDLYEGDNWLTLSNQVWPPLFYIDRLDIAEGNSGTTTALMNLRLSGGSGQEIQVIYATKDWTATNGTDYVGTNGTVIFPPFTTNQSIAVTILGDETYEADELVRVEIHGLVNAHLGTIDQYAWLTIRNDDTGAVFSIWDTSVVEGDQGFTNATFLITLSKPASTPLTISFRTEDGTATRTNDYTEQWLNPVFPAGATNLTVTVPVRGNTVNEPDEVFRARIGYYTTSASHTFARTQATATIINDDAVAGRLDHFAVGPIASPQHQGVTFPVSIAALDYENNPVPYDGTALLSCDTHSGVVVRLYDDFEDIRLDGWTNSIAAGFSALIVTNNAAQGTYSLLVSGQSPFYGPGLERRIASVSQDIAGQPNRLSFYVKARRTNQLSHLSLQYLFYRVFRFGFDANGLMGFWPGGEQQVRGVPYAADTWYKIGMDLSYERGALDYYVNDTLVLTNVPFLDWSYGNIDRMVIGSGSFAGESWWDDFRLEATNVYLKLPTTLTNITFANGVWNGEVAVGQFATNAILRVNDGLEHVGQSAFFNVLPPPQLSLSFSPAIIETAGQLPATVTSSIVLSNDILITLVSADTSEARVPQTVLLPAGQTSVAFTIEILDDNSLDGTQQPLIMAAAANFISATNRLLVHDNEVGVLSIPLVAQLTEGIGSAQSRVTVNAPVETNVIVRLTSSDTNQFIVPPETIILPGLTSAVFAITVVNDRYIDGTVRVTVTAHVENWVDGVATVDVRDNESTNLLLTFTGPFSEGLGLRTNIARLQLAGLPTTNVPVNLVSSDLTELQVPDFVTIPAGQTSLLFQVSFVDDNDFDGAQPVTVTATASGFAASSTNFLVLDNELHHVAFLPISGAITSGLPFGITLEARDINDRTMVEVSGPPVVFTLTATNEANGPVLLQGNTISLSGSGRASANVIAYSPAAVVRLFASDGADLFAQSDPFQVFAAAFRTFEVPAVHIAYDQVSRKIFAAVGTNGTNRITVIDPHRGLLESFVTLPYPPARLAVSANGQYLYVALQRTNQVLRLELPSLQSNLLFSLGPSLAWVTDMLVLSGSPGSLVVAHGTISVYDDGVKRPDDATTYSAGLITFGASEDVLYTGWGGSPAKLSELRILPTGVRLERELYAGASYYNEKSLRYADGLLYFGIGYVVDPRDGNRIDAISGDFVLPDSQANRISTLYSPGWPNMAAFGFYEQTTRSQLGELRITNLFGMSHSLLRWGSNGLAFITSGGFSNSTYIAGKVHLLRSPMLVAQPSADLSVRVTADTALGLINQDVTFTATVSNSGPNVVSNVYVRQSIRWTNVRASRANYLNRWRDLEFGALSPAETFTVDFVCRTNLPYALSNVVWAASAAHDPNTINNTAALTIPVTFQSLPDQVIEWPNLRVKDIAWDRRGKKLYAIDMADQLLALDPVRITNSVALSLGTNAYRLEVAPTGDYLYILQNTSTVRRLDLPGLNNPMQFNVPRQIYSMVIAPDRPELVAISSDSRMWLYENGVQRGTGITNGACCGLIAFGTSHSRLYSIRYAGTIVHYNAGPFGLAYEDEGGPLSYVYAASAGGRIYGSDGSIVDAETRLKIGQLPGLPSASIVLPDLANGILCYYSSYPELRVVDATTFASRGVIQQLYTPGWVVRMVRWGDDGIAFKNDYNRLTLMRTYAVGDHDRDGLSDGWERNHFGSTNALPTLDADGDGMLNLAEFQAGTNPTNAADALRIDDITGDKLRFRSVAGKYYTLERNPTLSTNTWTPSIRNVPGNDGPQELPIFQPGFYRLKLVQ